MTPAPTPMVIAALALDGQGGAREVPQEAVPAWQAGAGALWVHLDGIHPATRAWLLDDIGLDELVVEALLAEETRPRAQALAGGWLVVLRGVNLNPGAEPEDMVSIRLWSDGQRVISTRRRWVRAVAALREALRGGTGPADIGELVTGLAKGLVDNMQGYTQGLGDRLDELEEQVLTSESRMLRGDLSAQRREAVILRRHLAPQRDAILRLHGGQVPWIGADQRAALLETADELTRYVEDLDAMKDRAGILQETLTSRLSERMEQRMYSLSLVATIFLPLSFVTGLLGINVAGIPGSEFQWAFWVVVGLLLIVSALLVVVLRRREWF